MTELPRRLNRASASWRERRDLQQMQRALSRLQQLQHQEHSRCRLLVRELSAVAMAVTRWSDYRETAVAAARPDLVSQVDAELALWHEQQQETERQLARQRDLLVTLDARASVLQQRFLAIARHWPPQRSRELASDRVRQELQRYEQQFVRAERRLPALQMESIPAATDKTATDVLSAPVAAEAMRRSGQGGTSP